MLEVHGNCSIASFVYDTALCIAWVHVGPAQVLCGLKRQCWTCVVIVSCVVYDIALCVASVHAGPAQEGSIVCVAAAIRGVGPRGSCAGPAWSHAGHVALAASRVHSIRKRCGPIVWRGSTRVLEEARGESLEGSPVLGVRGDLRPV